MRNTVGEIKAAARLLLGDTAISTGGAWNNTKLQLPFSLAYADLFSAKGSKRISAKALYFLQPYQSAWDPVQDYPTFGSPDKTLEYRESSSDRIRDITGLTVNDSGVTIGISSAVANAVNGVFVRVYRCMGMYEGMTGEYPIVVINPTTYLLPGFKPLGSMTGVGKISVGGTLSEWKPMNIAYNSADFNRGWLWDNQIFRFYPDNTWREIRFNYLLSANSPDSDSDYLKIDDCYKYMATRTAYYASIGKNPKMAMQHGEDSGAEMDRLKQQWARESQGQQWQTEAYNPQTVQGPVIIG